MLVRASAFALSGVLLAPTLAFGADGEDTRLGFKDVKPAETAEKVGTSGASIVRTIVGLAVVIGVIYGLTWVLKQTKASKRSGASGAGLETLATLPLGTNRSLHLVRAGDEVVIVGAGEQGVNPIRTYSEAEARALGLLDAEPTAMEVAAPEVFGTETRRGRFIDELRRRTVIK